MSETASRATADSLSALIGVLEQPSLPACDIAQMALQHGAFDPFRRRTPLAKAGRETVFKLFLSRLAMSTASACRALTSSPGRGRIPVT